MEIMRDPVMAMDGFMCPPHPPQLRSMPTAWSPLPSPSSLSLPCSYERCSIEAWFAKGKTTSPKTGAELSSEGHGARGGIACSAA